MIKGSVPADDGQENGGRPGVVKRVVRAIGNVIGRRTAP